MFLANLMTLNDYKLNHYFGNSSYSERRRTAKEWSREIGTVLHCPQTAQVSNECFGMILQSRVHILKSPLYPSKGKTIILFTLDGISCFDSMFFFDLRDHSCSFVYIFNTF